MGLRGQGVKGLGHSIGQTIITVSYGVRAWSCWHIANGNKTCRRLFTRVIFLWEPAQRKRATMLYVANVLFIYFLWPPYSPALVNGGSRKFYTWWTLSVIREVTTWIFSGHP